MALDASRIVNWEQASHRKKGKVESRTTLAHAPCWIHNEILLFFFFFFRTDRTKLAGLQLFFSFLSTSSSPLFLSLYVAVRICVIRVVPSIPFQLSSKVKRYCICFLLPNSNDKRKCHVRTQSTDRWVPGEKAIRPTSQDRWAGWRVGQMYTYTVRGSKWSCHTTQTGHK